MHGCGLTSIFLVNAEVDSMGGVLEHGVGTACKTSPITIERIQGELRQEYNVRDNTKRELEFLEKGGNPLDLLNPGDAASGSVQSTSFTNQHQDHLVNSEAKGSFAITASPHGDSLESSGRLGANHCEPNSADNLMLFDGEHEFSEGNRRSLHPTRSNIVPSKKLSQMDESHRTREDGESNAFNVPRKAYKRRNRSRPNRDGIKLSAADVNTTHGSHGSSLPSDHGRNLKGLTSDAENQNTSINCNSKELDGVKAVESSKNLLEHVAVEAASNAIASETPLDNQCNQQSQPDAVETRLKKISDASEAVQPMEEMTSAVSECQLIGTVDKTGNESTSCQINSEKERTNYDAHKAADLCGVKVFDSQSSCAQHKTIDGNNAGDTCHKMTNANSNGRIRDDSALNNPESTSTHLMQQDIGLKLHHDDELNESGFAMKSEVKSQTAIESMAPREPSGSESGIKPDLALNGNPEPRDEIPHTVENQPSYDTSISDVKKGGNLTRNSTVSLEAQTSSCINSKLEPEIDEDSILKEAKIIQAKRKRISELSVMTSARKKCPKSQWDFVLEEMAWLANDFAQERMWKIAAAAQISSRSAFACQLRKRENCLGMEAKKVAHTLAKSVMEFWHLVEDNKMDVTVPIQAYAARFLKHNNSTVIDNRAQLPLTPDRASDVATVDLSWEENLTEENLFFTVPPGAMQTYKISVESQSAQSEIIGSVLEEVETSACDAAADYESQDPTYDEDEGEINTYESSRFGQKRRKHSMHAYGVRPYKASSNLSPMQYPENKAVNQQSTLMAKRPGGSLNVAIPTKRVRTASRRVITTFSIPNKTDASSGDTNSFQDDQNSLEVESVGEFSKQSPFHSAEVVMKHKKKKKKAKHLNAAYEPRWQVNTTYQMDQFQRDNQKKAHQLDSNGNSGLFGPPVMKKPKIMRPSQDNSFETLAPVAGSAPSPVASQMSNMSNPNKFIKMLGGRDRGRKPKDLKLANGQLASGNPWTLFEDQALVVLAHDLGPNWELVSDAINTTLQFKFIFRKAKECKERHNFLMDRTSGDGADSAEDSGSSQPYPSTLPGIPKGSARQLFQRLQGPMEEETLKSHFEKIIIIGREQQYRRNQDPKQLQQPHGSHTVALSQVCPNNLNGGPVLTPLDFCDSTITGPDTHPIGYQVPHHSGLTTIANQTQIPASGVNSSLQGSPNTMVGNNFSSSQNSSIRDGRYIAPRSASVDEQQRLQQYNQMRSDRNLPHSNLSPSGSNGMGLVSGVNRSLPMARPGFQGIASPSIVNSGSMVSPGVSPPNIHSGIVSGQGISTLRPREPLHMIRPGMSPDSPRPMVSPELPTQHSPGNSQPRRFGGLSPPFPNHPHFQSPTNHGPTNPQSQAYALRLAKETHRRILQQQQQQQQQFAGSSSLLPHVHSQSQLPISPSLPNSSQLQSQVGSPPVSLSPLTSLSSTNSTPHHQQKLQTLGQGAVRNSQGGGSAIANQSGKQRQRLQQQQQQQLQQANRQHPQQRQQQPQAKPHLVSSQPTASIRPPNQSLTQQKNHRPVNPDQQKMVSQNQVALQRLQQNRQMNPDPSKPQRITSNADQQPTTSSTEMAATTTLPQTTGIATNAVKAVSSEPLLDTHATNMSSTLSLPPSATLPSSNFQQSSQPTQPNSSVPQHPQPPD